MLVQCSEKGLQEQKVPMGRRMRRELWRQGTDPV